MIGARSVWSGLCGAQTASALPTNGRLTEAGQGQFSWSGERLSMAVHGQTRMLNAPAVSKSFGSLLLLLRVFFETKHSTVNCQPLRSFSRVKPVGDRLHHQQTHAKVKRTGSFPDKVGDYAPVVSLQGVIPRRYALQFFLPSTVQIKARSIPPHGLERSAQLSLLC
jgi:hypothetical protein